MRKGVRPHWLNSESLGRVAALSGIITLGDWRGYDKSRLDSRDQVPKLSVHGTEEDNNQG
jgi:hypothetical protein